MTEDEAAMFLEMLETYLKQNWRWRLSTYTNVSPSDIAQETLVRYISGKYDAQYGQHLASHGLTTDQLNSPTQSVLFDEFLIEQARKIADALVHRERRHAALDKTYIAEVGASMGFQDDSRQCVDEDIDLRKVRALLIEHVKNDEQLVRYILFKSNNPGAKRQAIAEALHLTSKSVSNLKKRLATAEKQLLQLLQQPMDARKQ